jgi:hypothetical protein
MPVNEAARRGNLSETPFAQVLAEIWRDGLTGLLTVRTSGGSKRLTFEKGALTVEPAAFPEKDFLQSLLTSGAVDLIGLARAEDYARACGQSVVRGLIDSGLLPPGRLWELLETFAREAAYGLLDCDEGEFEFAPAAGPAGPAYIRNVSIPGLILEGSRRMGNESAFARHLPTESETVQSLDLAALDGLTLAPHEAYLLDLLGSARSVADLVEASDLGERETRRILFVFLILGLAGARAPKPKTARLPAEMSLADMDKIFGAINTKFSNIFKYVSKEIGPVALSVIGNSLEDVRSRLDPAFQGLELKPDGRIELKSYLKTNMNLIGEDNRRGLLRSMDEILVAEVLAVKRTLGPAHESTLVKSLERIGELP